MSATNVQSDTSLAIQEARHAFSEDFKYIEDILRAGRLRRTKNLSKEEECKATSSGGTDSRDTI